MGDAVHPRTHTVSTPTLSLKLQLSLRHDTFNNSHTTPVPVRNARKAVQTYNLQINHCMHNTRSTAYV